MSAGFDAVTHDGGDADGDGPVTSVRIRNYRQD
jgi:hypothetical protein